jgi:rhamnosyltransferase subunit B
MQRKTTRLGHSYRRRRMRVLIVAGGSHGDNLPFIALGREFQRNGHEVRLYANEYFAALAEEAGLPFRAHGTSEQYLATLQDPNLNHPFRILNVIADMLDRGGRELFDAMAADVVPGETIIVNNALAFAARFVSEAHGIPSATVHLQPAILRSSPAFLAPRLLKKCSWYLLDKLALDPTIGAALNRRRLVVGLPPINRPFNRWIHDSDALVGLFPQWFAQRHPDWPSHLQLTGFPMYDGKSAALPATVEAFLAQGEPPIAFTAGTATAASHNFFAVSAQACRRSGKRGILLTHVAEQIPDKLPSGVAHFAYAPFSSLLPHVSAFVHHGGIGTLSQALRAGVPQLIRPMAHDQFDNADRAVRFGVAMKLLPRDYRVSKVVNAIERLTSDTAMRERCTQLAGNFSDDSVAVACNHILDILGPKTSASSR